MQLGFDAQQLWGCESTFIVSFREQLPLFICSWNHARNPKAKHYGLGSEHRETSEDWLQVLALFTFPERATHDVMLGGVCLACEKQ